MSFFRNKQLENEPLLEQNSNLNYSTVGKESFVVDMEKLVYIMDIQNDIVSSPRSIASGSMDENVDSENELSLLEPYFDMSMNRMQIIFDKLDTEGKGSITIPQLQDGMKMVGISCRTSEKVFREFVENVVSFQNQKQELQLRDFRFVVQQLKLSDLFQKATMERIIEHGYVPGAIKYVEYNQHFLKRRHVAGKSELQRFFYKPSMENRSRHSDPAVAWINIAGEDPLNLKRLSIKYALHPLAIEDTLEKHERPKFDVYDEHSFIVFPIMLIGTECRRKTSYVRSSSSMRRLQDAMQEQGGTDYNTSITMEHLSIFIVGERTLITVHEDDDLNGVLWKEVNRRLQAPYSKLRQNSVNFLLYTILDVIVDQIGLVVDALSAKIIRFEEEIEDKKHRFKIAKLRQLKNELLKLPRVLKPAKEVVKHIAESKTIDDDTRKYLHDVQDHLIQIIDDIDTQFQMCRTLTEQHRDSKANQMNYVIYTLTIITTVFLPAQVDFKIGLIFLTLLLSIVFDRCLWDEL